MEKPFWVMVVKTSDHLPGCVSERPGAPRGRTQADRPLPEPPPQAAAGVGVRRGWCSHSRTSSNSRARSTSGRMRRACRLYVVAPILVIFSEMVTLGDPPVRQRPGRDRPLYRSRRLDQRALLLQPSAPSHSRVAARRLALGLEVQLPRRHAVGRPAHLLRGLDGPGAPRRGDDDRLALPHPRRRRTRCDPEHRDPDHRLPDLHDRRLRGNRPSTLRTCQRPTPSWCRGS